MCELFAMSSRIPATVTFSLEEFARHGGLTGPARDGWGIAYYDDGDVRLLKEPEAAAESEVVRFIETHDLRSDLVISHIRKATQGARSLKNTQPFVRELGGHMHVFAHNGKLPGIERHPALTLGRYRPVGMTDSEYACCALLERMRALWHDGKTTPSIQTRLEVVMRFAEIIRDLGPANFLYADGDLMFAHGHRRTQANGEIRPPGLVSLCRSCAGEPSALNAPGLTIAVPGERPWAQAALPSGRQDVVLVASVPLTDEPWEALAEGEVVAMAAGRVLERSVGH